MFHKVDDVLPKTLQQELLRLAKLDRNWLEWRTIPDEPGQLKNRYSCEVKYPTWIRKLWKSGADGFVMWAASLWLVDGPKIFRPSKEQCTALEQVDVRITLSDYSQPYPTLLVDLPTGYEPFTTVLCHRSERMLTCVSHSIGNLNDITTTIAVDGRPIEESLHRYDDDAASLAVTCGRILRVAVNSCLCLVNYGYMSDYLYPKEVESDKRLARENSPRGEKARYRVVTAPFLTKFSQEVTLHRVEKKDYDPNPTGREVKSHWRRGHWAVQVHGPQMSLRKRILRPPVLVRADKFLGDQGDTTTVYRS